MSFQSTKRNKSRVQYLATAQEIEVAVLQIFFHRVKKTYRMISAIPAYTYAYEAHDYAKKANSIFPKDAETAAMRRRYLIEARCSLQALISRLEISKLANLADGIESKHWLTIFTLIDQELTLLDGVLKSDANKKYC